MSAIKKTRIFAVLLGSGLLGYGVMVTLQILVLPFLVRVRVAQQRERRMTVHSSFFVPFRIFHTQKQYICEDNMKW